MANLFFEFLQNIFPLIPNPSQEWKIDVFRR